jgi:molybdopterin-guanine dinucleotide biosynthesis protein B
MIPLLAIAAWSGTGKTTLLKRLIPELCALDYVRADKAYPS